MLILANALKIPLADRSVHCVVTSPPYWGLRDYGIPATVWGGDPACSHEWSIEAFEREIRTGMGLAKLSERYRGGGHKQGKVPLIRGSSGFCCKCGAWRGALGLEPTPELFVDHIVQVFREVRRVLRDDGTCWLNIGDSYDAGTRSTRDTSPKTKHGYWNNPAINLRPKGGLGAKQLLGIPWRMAFALQDDGWYLRQDIIWHKPNPMPESCRDRCTKAHEYLFLFTKRPRYYYDAEAIRETATYGYRSFETAVPRAGRNAPSSHMYRMCGDAKEAVQRGPKETGVSYDKSAGRNKRSVWTITSEPYKGAHFATYPRKLVEPCILAGTSAAGCCPICGAGWVRQTTSRRVPTRPGTDSKIKVPSGWDTGDGAHGAFHRDGRGKPEYRDRSEVGNRDPQRHCTQTQTVNWKPGCDCQPDPKSQIQNPKSTVPAVVLDPFGGSGTTEAVAIEHGRRGISLDLNPDYLALARRRIGNVTPPLMAALV